jgi:hypothetical protein
MKMSLLPLPPKRRRLRKKKRRLLFSNKRQIRRSQLQMHSPGLHSAGLWQIEAVGEAEAHLLLLIDSPRLSLQLKLV